MPQPMTEIELAEVWATGASRAMWNRVLDEGAPGEADMARRIIDDLPNPLVTLEAAAELASRVHRGAWSVILFAREGGASWDEIGEAMHTSAEGARARYAAALSLLAEVPQAAGIGMPRLRAALDDVPQHARAGDPA